MPKILLSFLIAFLCFLSSVAHAAEDALINLGVPSAPQTIAPGAVILLPDGAQSVILESLPNGDLITDLGITLSPQGLIRDGEFKGQAVTLDPSLTTPKITEKAAIPEVEKGKTEPPAATAQMEKPESAKAAVPLVQPKVPAVAPEKNPKSPEREEQSLTLAQMLPLTSIDGKKAQPAKIEEKTPQKKVQQPEEQKKQPDKPKASEPKKLPQNTPEKNAKKPEPKAHAQTPKAGEPLRIPADAPKTGDLSFLEGCWQGTRPEYFSKRTIKECFCFNANGKSGKRRIFDGANRTCIGATKANLSSTGVLSVTSSGAACNDGERWGSAEMVCRNSGPRTPCSWVFTDANNGRQSYEIPFVRVESCGR